MLLLVKNFSSGKIFLYLKGKVLVIVVNLLCSPYFSLIGNLGSSNLSLFISIIPNKLISNRIVGYYPSWVQNQYSIGSVDFSTFSHLIHAFAWPNNQGEIISDIGTFNSNFASQVQSQGSKFLLAIGGWGTAAGFVASTATHEIRSYFISNIIDIVDQYGYDGIDIDWEYPQTNEQRNNLNLFISELDSTLNIHNPDLILSMAVPISNWAGQWYDFSNLRPHVDFFNAMTYDIHGGWSSHAGHNSPLYQSPPGDADGSIETGINYLANTRGLPEEKINMGIPFWGKQYDTSTINGRITLSYENINEKLPKLRVIPTL